MTLKITNISSPFKKKNIPKTICDVNTLLFVPETRKEQNEAAVVVGVDVEHMWSCRR